MTKSVAKKNEFSLSAEEKELIRRHRRSKESAFAAKTAILKEDIYFAIDLEEFDDNYAMTSSFLQKYIKRLSKLKPMAKKDQEIYKKAESDEWRDKSGRFLFDEFEGKNLIKNVKVVK
jgi:hypothetical protein